MKHGGEYAKRVKRLYQQIVHKAAKPPAMEPTDPIEQLIIGILSGCTSMAKAQAVFRKLRQQMVDLNELRVTPPMELAELIGDSLPLAREKAQRVVDALNGIRKRQDSLDISFLKQRGRREARDYLESLEGVDKAAAASVVLYSLGGHAIPVDDLALYVLQKEEFIPPGSDAAEVQGFLERHVGANDSRAFAEGLNRYVLAKGVRVQIGKLAQLLRPAPPAPPPVEAPKPAPPPPRDGQKAPVAPAPAAGSKANQKSKPVEPPPRKAVPEKAMTPAADHKPAVARKKK